MFKKYILNIGSILIKKTYTNKHGKVKCRISNITNAYPRQNTSVICMVIF